MENVDENDLSSWKDVLYYFTQSSSLHGFDKITEPQPFLLRRVVWLLIVLGGIALFAYQLCTSVIMYRSFPVTVNIKVNYNESVTFPAVTICNQNMFRVLWSLVVIGGLVLFSQTLVSSIITYISWPVTVNIKVNYNITVTFPAITICNQNTFRTTKSAELGYYKVLSDVYAFDLATKAENITGDHPVTNMTMLDIYQELEHKPQDFIMKCRWQKIQCSFQDFEKIITNHGVCYTFNNKNDTPLNTLKTGVGSGLSVRLNIEQYEYMPGPNLGAGVKILVHNQGDTPLVKEMGQSVMPGAHALVGIQTKDFHNLPPPYGKCNDDVELEYFRSYTYFNCLLDCEAVYIVNQCNCRLQYMPPSLLDPDYPPLCTMKQYLYCTAFLNDKFGNVKTSFCSCPTPCDRRIFESFVSYGAIPQFHAQRMLLSEQASELTEKYLYAREVQDRVDDDIIKRDYSIVDQVRVSTMHLKGTFYQIATGFDQALSLIEYEVKPTINKRIDSHLNVIINHADYVMATGFTSPLKKFLETFKDYVTTYRDYYKDLRVYFERVERSVNQLMKDAIMQEMKEYIDTFRHKTIFLKNTTSEIRDLLSDNKPLWKMAMYIGDESFRWQPSTLSFSDTFDDAFINQKMVQDVFTAINYASLPNTIVNTDIILGSIDVLKDKFPYDPDKFAESKEIIFGINHDGQRQMWLRIFAELERSVDDVEQTLEQKIDDSFTKMRTNFDRANLTVVKELRDLIITIESTKTEAEVFLEKLFKMIEIVRLSNSYIWNPNPVGARKTDIAKVMLSDKIADEIIEMGNIVDQLIVRVGNIQHDKRKFFEAHDHVWDLIKSEGTFKEVYSLLYEDFQLLMSGNKSDDVEPTRRGLSALFNTRLDTIYEIRNMFHMSNADIEDPTSTTSWLEGMEQVIKHFTDKLDIDKSSTGHWKQFYDGITEWNRILMDFLENSKLDITFTRDNFLDIDFFMKELYYEEVEQQVGYDIVNLLSDIGGSLGLFVGASVISVFEILDVFIHNFLLMKMSPKKNQKTSNTVKEIPPAVDL